MPEISVPTVASLTTLGGAALLISVIVQIIKQTTNLSADIWARFGELIAVVTGIIIVVVATAAITPLEGATAFQAAVTGIYAGLAAIGLYHATNTVAGGGLSA